MLKVENLKIEYVHVLFEKLSFLLGNGEKVGLVGLNGCGKSTLLRIIAGEEKADAGTVEMTKTETLQYLPQEFGFEQELVGEYLESLVSNPQAELWKVRKILNKLQLDVDDYQYIDTLSEGQKMKLYLAKLLVNEPTILLLDEPTNHLDIDGIIWFEQFVQHFEGICIVISHDRSFLNSTVDQIFEIDEGKLNVFQGNYDEYVHAKVEWIAERDKQFHLQESKRRQLETLLANANKIADGKKRGRAMQAAKKRMEREVLRTEIDDYQESGIKKLGIKGEVHASKQIMKIENLDFAYSKGQKLFVNADFHMYGREKVWLYGPNGSGKTTLINLIMGELQADAGIAKIGDNMHWQYFSQTQSHLPMDMKVRDYFMATAHVEFAKSFGVLQQFLFSKELQDYPIHSLSPGQRARLSFAAFAQGQYDFLILDEPTNHLDIKTKEVIEQALAKYQGAIFLISHDSYFVEHVG